MKVNNNNKDRSGYKSNSLDSNQNADGENLEFVDPGLISGVANAAKIVGQVNRGVRAINKLRSGDVEGAAIETGNAEAVDLSQQIKALTNAVNSIGGGNGGMKGTGKSGYTIPPSGGSKGPNNDDVSLSYLNLTRLNIEPHPTEVRMSTGIRPDTFTPDYNSSEFGYHSPLQITGARFSFPQTSATDAGGFYNVSVLNELRVIIQRNISFSTDITVANLADYLNKLAYALQAYYYLTRYLTYAANPMNKNEGMLYMANTITNDVADRYLALRRYLSSIPIPPNLNTFLFFFSQTYCTSPLPDGQLVAICPFPLTSTGDTKATPDWSYITTALNQLQTTDCLKTTSVLGRAIPNWFNTQLLTGISNPLHDDNFTTIWRNLPYHHSGTGYEFYGPYAASTTSSVNYNAWTENLDGGAYALMAMTDRDQWFPSLVQPIVTDILNGPAHDYTNRMYFDTDGFYNVYYSSALSAARMETCMTDRTLDDAVAVSYTSSQRCWGVTPKTVTNCCYQMIDWLLSWDTINSRVEKSLADNGPYSSKYKFTGSNNSISTSKAKRGRPKFNSKGKNKDTK